MESDGRELCLMTMTSQLSSSDRSEAFMPETCWTLLEEAVQESRYSNAGAPAEMPDRAFLEAVFWLIRNEARWRDLPEDLGAWRAVYMRFRRWEENETWSRLWVVLQEPRFVDVCEIITALFSTRTGASSGGGQRLSVQSRLLRAFASTVS